MDMSLAADLLLLAYDDEKGRPRISSTELDASLAGAAVLDLIMSGALRIDDSHEKAAQRRLRATGTTVADPVLADIVEYVDGMKAKAAISGVAGVSNFRNRSRSLRESMLDQLADAGLLRKEEGTFLGFIPNTRWTEVDGRHEDDLVDRIRRAVLGGGIPDQRTAALVSLLSATGLLVKVLPGSDTKLVKARGKEIAKGDWAAKGIKDAVDTVNTILITTTVILPAVTSGSN